MKNRHQQTLALIKLVFFCAASLPLIVLLLGAWQDQLGANPVEKITHETGFWTLTLLLVALVPTPLRRLTGLQWPVLLRRMLGLFAFFYACLHFGSYLILDQFFDWSSIGQDIIKRPYITVGFSAFVLLIPLAITSRQALQRRLGGKRWRQLHRLVYLIAIAGVVHFAWLVKKDLSQPLKFAFLLVLLLGLRLYYRLRHSRQSAGH